MSQSKERFQYQIMNEYDLLECLEAYAWKISEVIQALPKCPHKASGQCAVCMDIQTRLGLISIQLGADPDVGLGSDFQQNALLVVRILRDMCSWPRVSNWEMSQGNYPSISDLRGFVDDSKNLAALRKGIVAYLRQPSFVLRGLSSKCEELLDQFQTDDSDDLIESPEPEDLSTVHRKFLPLLRTYAACDSCQSSLTSQEGASWHPSRLVLTGPKRNGDDTVRFDVITSSLVDYSWQDVCIDMPILSGNPIDFCQDNTATDGRCCEQKLRMNMEPLTTFCDFFQHDDGCRIALKLEDGVLLRLGAEALKHRTTPGKGLALADVLDQYELSIKERLALAHAICLAFWQFYDSELMHRPWNSQTIWFMPEPDLRGKSEKLPLKVYISFHPEATECAFDSTEFATTKALIHRCPRIQALAILLLETGLGKPLRCPHFDRETLSLNYRYSLATQYLEDIKNATWNNFAHKHIYTDAVEDCLKFDGLMGKEKGTRPYDPSSRRQLLHERVLSRVEWLNRAFRGRDDKLGYLSTKRALEQPQSNEKVALVTLAENLQSRPLSKVTHEANIECLNRPKSRQDFKIAVICALSHEADAMEALFDAHWDDNGPPYDKAPQDPNAYSTGSIGRHNVVLAHMPGMGKANATRVATFCRISFPNITLALIVGICGAVPFTPDSGDEVVLGDVIISDGIVQYDFGKRLPDRFIPKDTLLDSLGRPNTEIRSLLAKLKSIYSKEALRNKTIAYVNELRKTPELKADYPGVDNDFLFQPTVHHLGGGKTCKESGCKGELIRRLRLDTASSELNVHFGLIASGDTVMKAGDQRDKIAQQQGVIGFEMEGAGVWDSFPSCLVIKGVCDYADSHKTKLWQSYAAVTAAACTKAFLSYWVPHQEQPHQGKPYEEQPYADEVQPYQSTARRRRRW